MPLPCPSGSLAPVTLNIPLTPAFFHLTLLGVKSPYLRSMVGGIRLWDKGRKDGGSEYKVWNCQKVPMASIVDDDDEVVHVDTVTATAVGFLGFAGGPECGWRTRQG